MQSAALQKSGTPKATMSQPQPKIITPSIGRRVWYWPSTYDRGLLLDKPSTTIEANTSQPCDAGVVCVHGDRLVNLSVTDHNGNVHKRTSVTLYQPGDNITHADGGYAVWMDYQINQAAPPKSTTTEKCFAYAHLPAHLQVISKPLGQLAELMEQLLPGGPEKSAGMRKLLEAKDCFVRAALDCDVVDLLASSPVTDTDRIRAWCHVMLNGQNLDPELEKALEKVSEIETDDEADLLLHFTKFLDVVVAHQRAPKQHTEGPDDFQG